MADSNPPSPKAPKASTEATSVSDFNRITLPTDFKSQICSQIADSTESLPYWQTSHRESIQSTASQDDVPDESDLLTPLPKDKNPLDAAGAAQAHANGADQPLSATKSNGNPLSQVTTASDEDLGSKKGRPNPLRRLTTKIKRTISSGQK